MPLTEEMVRRAGSAIMAGAGVIGIAAFTTWGFDPQSWTTDMRLIFALSFTWVMVLAYAYPGHKKDW